MSADSPALLKGGALLLVALVAGWAIGTALGAAPVVGPLASASAAPATPTVRPVAELPDAEHPGRDLNRLPRYPGSVRTAFLETTDEHYRLVAAEFVADAPIEDVRGFYQSVIRDHDWQRADIGYHDGAWTYVLVDGRFEGLIEIEITDGLVEIDLQVSMPIDSPTPAPTARPPAAPPPAPTPPPGDGDGDDDDDSDDDDSTDDDDSDD